MCRTWGLILGPVRTLVIYYCCSCAGASCCLANAVFAATPWPSICMAWVLQLASGPTFRLDCCITEHACQSWWTKCQTIDALVPLLSRSCVAQIIIVFGFLPSFRSSRILNVIGLCGTQYSTLYFTISAIIKGYTPGALTRWVALAKLVDWKETPILLAVISSCNNLVCHSASTVKGCLYRFSVWERISLSIFSQQCHKLHAHALGFLNPRPIWMAVPGVFVGMDKAKACVS